VSSTYRSQSVVRVPAVDIGAEARAAMAAAEAIEQAGRQALAEMRQILGALRVADDGRVLHPQPGLGSSSGTGQPAMSQPAS
jgi:hypothetical protein